MNTYETLAYQFNNALGGQYNILYNNNDSVEWDKIITDNVIHAVMTIQGGQVGKLSGLIVESKIANIAFAIPTDIEVFSQAIQDIEDKFTAFNQQVITLDSVEVQVGYNYRTDASYLGAINGVKYSLVTVNLTLLITDSIVFGNETTVTFNSLTIDGTTDDYDLEGIISVQTNNKFQFDPVVLSGSNGKITNYFNSKQASLVVNVTLIKNNGLHTLLFTNRFSNTTYSITVDEVLGQFTKSMEVSDFTVNSVVGNAVNCTIVFLEV